VTRPALRVVRTDDPAPLERAPVAIRLQVTPRPRRRDGVAFGIAATAAMFVGAVLIALVMGWIH